MAVDTETLRIREFILLGESDELVRAVLNEETSYKKLIVESMTSTFDTCFEISEQFETFWKTLGKSVETLDLYEVQTPPFLQLYFNNLRELYIYDISAYSFLSAKFFQNNRGLELLSTGSTIFEICQNDEVRIHKTFFKILKDFASLKSLTAACTIPLIRNNFRKVFRNLNSATCNLIHVRFECKPLPKLSNYANYYWNLEVVKMEFIRDGEARKLIVKPYEIVEKLMPGKTECEPNCSLNHQVFTIYSVKQFKFSERHKCIDYYKSFVKSFPYCDWIHELRFNNIAVLRLMSEKLEHLTKLSFHYDGPLVDEWPPFPNLAVVDVRLSESSYKSFEKFIKSFPNVQELVVVIEAGITRDDAGKIITENLKGLEWLSLHCNVEGLY